MISQAVQDAGAEALNITEFDSCAPEGNLRNATEEYNGVAATLGTIMILSIVAVLVAILSFRMGMWYAMARSENIGGRTLLCFKCGTWHQRHTESGIRFCPECNPRHFARMAPREWRVFQLTTIANLTWFEIAMEILRRVVTLQCFKSARILRVAPPAIDGESSDERITDSEPDDEQEPIAVDPTPDTNVTNNSTINTNTDVENDQRRARVVVVGNLLEAARNAFESQQDESLREPSQLQSPWILSSEADAAMRRFASVSDTGASRGFPQAERDDIATVRTDMLRQMLQAEIGARPSTETAAVDARVFTNPNYDRGMVSMEWERRRLQAERTRTTRGNDLDYVEYDEDDDVDVDSEGPPPLVPNSDGDDPDPQENINNQAHPQRKTLDVDEFMIELPKVDRKVSMRHMDVWLLKVIFKELDIGYQWTDDHYNRVMVFSDHSGLVALYPDGTILETQPQLTVQYHGGQRQQLPRNHLDGSFNIESTLLAYLIKRNTTMFVEKIQDGSRFGKNIFIRRFDAHHLHHSHHANAEVQTVMTGNLPKKSVDVDFFFKNLVCPYDKLPLWNIFVSSKTVDGQIFHSSQMCSRINEDSAWDNVRMTPKTFYACARCYGVSRFQESGFIPQKDVRINNEWTCCSCNGHIQYKVKAICPVCASAVCSTRCLERHLTERSSTQNRAACISNVNVIAGKLLQKQQLRRNDLVKILEESIPSDERSREEHESFEGTMDRFEFMDEYPEDENPWQQYRDSRASNRPGSSTDDQAAYDQVQ